MEETPGYSQKFEQKSAPREKKSLEIDWILLKRKIYNLYLYNTYKINSPLKSLSHISLWKY